MKHRGSKARSRPGSRLARDQVQVALASLSPQDLRGLSQFARSRLHLVGLPQHLGEDVAQRALLQVAVGGRKKRRGRHPRISHLEGEAFLPYLRSVVVSLVDTQRGLVENRYSHFTWDEGDPAHAPNSAPASDVIQHVAFKELCNVLFHRLREQSPPRLQPLLRAWQEQRFDCDVIPLAGGHRRHRSELRQRAAEILKSLVCDPSHPQFHFDPAITKKETHHGK